MFSAYDSESNFYYFGETEPSSHIWHDLLDNATTISCDVETISLKERMPLGIGISVDPDHSFYFPLFPNLSPVVPWHLLKSPNVRKIFHNAIFDLYCLREYEIDMTNIMDTNVMSRMLCYKWNSLSDLAGVHMMEVHDAGDMLKEHGCTTMLEMPPDIVANKCMQDSSATFKLYLDFWPRSNQSYVLEEMDIIPILIKMSWRGIEIDQEYRQEIEDKLAGSVDWLEGICKEQWNMNPYSGQQVGYILAKEGAYKVFHKLPFTGKKGQWGNLSTAKETLEQMDSPIASMVLEVRSKHSFLNSYVQPWGREDRAYTRFHLDAVTGRPSSTERNMQNIPPLKDSAPDLNIRGALVPDSGIFSDVDHSQLELRCLAYITGDREMQYIFSLPRYNPDGSINLEADIHQQTANLMGIPRKIAKNVNFAMVYGGSEETLMTTAKIRDRSLATRLIRTWQEKYPQAGDQIDAWQEEVKHGETIVQTLHGRNILLPDPTEEGLPHTLSCCINYRIQGTAAEVLKDDLRICKDMDMALTVHDEILFDGYVKKDWVKEKLENHYGVYTPTETKYLVRWQ